MIRILGLWGSLRQGSYNTALLRNAAGLMPEGSELGIATIAGIPLYNSDKEAANGLPGAVAASKEAITGADGLLLATPEYNNGIPEFFKNAIDWASRPPQDTARILSGKSVAVIGALPDGFGTVLAQDSWWPVLRTLGTRPWWEERFMVSRAGQHFDSDGELYDDAERERLKAFVAGFVAFVASLRRA